MKSMSLIKSLLIAALGLGLVTGQAQAFDSNQFYQIVNKKSQRALDVVQASTVNGANVIQWSYWEGAHQQWQILPNDDGSYRILNRNSGQALDVAGASTADNGNILQWPWKSANNYNQRWQISNLGNGYYSLISYHSGKAVQPEGGSSRDGANIVQATYFGGDYQQWQIKPVAAAIDPFALVGFATQNGGTTGGQGGKTVTVSTLADFQRNATASEPTIIRVNGILKLSGMVKVGSNKTILGVGSNSGFTGGGLQLRGVRNVIIRNLKLSFSRDDLIKIDNASNIWVDHNEFWNDRNHDKDYYDGLLDITHGSDYITVSWNKFRDHHKGSLVGHSDSNASEDRGRLRVTYHHNLFDNVSSRVPSFRFGTGHFYNNHVRNSDFAVNARMGAQLLVEGNVFESVKLPIATDQYSDENGYVVERNNQYVGSGANRITRTGSFRTPTYAYRLDEAAKVAAIVAKNAGVGVLK